MFIDQKAHYAKPATPVHRASATFYFRSTPNFRTTISFLNYWKLKRGIDVDLRATVRALSGETLLQEDLKFTQGPVLHYTTFNKTGVSEGSVEIEAFSEENLVIPYAAVMGIYETPCSISMAHTYSRVYSESELHSANTIDSGAESCWTIRDEEKITSFAVLHNGDEFQPEQEFTLEVTNVFGEKRKVCVPCPPLERWQTVIVRPKDWILDLASFLGSEPGNAALNFKVKNAFTRLLVGNETANEFQVAHSNFNYRNHQTDHLKWGKIAIAYPYVEGKSHELALYPDFAPGKYQVCFSDNSKKIISDSGLTHLPISHGPASYFSIEGEKLPSRFLTGLRLTSGDSILPTECPLPVGNSQRPSKHLWWGVAAATPHRSRLYLIPLTTIYGNVKLPMTLSLHLYSPASHESLRAEILFSEDWKRGKFLEDVFKGAEEFLNGQWGWFTLHSEYGGFYLFTTLENEQGNLALEHGF